MMAPGWPTAWDRRAVISALAGAATAAVRREQRHNDVARETAQHLTILHTADIHGQLEPHDEMFWEDERPVFRRRGGFASLRTLINEVRREAPGPVLLVDSGDSLQGSGVAALSQGAAVVRLMNSMGYDVVLPGNWEVIYGKERLLGNLRQYRGAVICANMHHDESAASRLLFPPFTVLNQGGIRVGFLGYNDVHTPIRQSPAYSRGIRFTSPDETIARYVQELRQTHRCDVVIALTHLGLAQQLHLADNEVARGADFVLGGDTHERVREPLQGRYAQVTEPGAFGSFVGRLDLTVENGRVVEHRYRLLDVDPDRHPPDRDVARLVAAERAPFREQLDRVIGRTATPLHRYLILETPLDNLITDALMWRFKPDIVVSNGFRFCPPLVPNESGFADITMDYLWSMLPVDSEVKMAEVTGTQISSWLERELENVFATDPVKRFGGWFVRFQGMKVIFRIGAPMGRRVQSVEIGGAPISPSATYSLLACEREGDPDDTLCRLLGVANPRRVQARLHQVMIDYLRAHSPVAPRIEGRAVAVDGPTVLLSQLAGTSYRFR